MYPGWWLWSKTVHSDRGFLCPAVLRALPSTTFGPRACFAKGICAGVERIRQDFQNGVVDRQRPHGAPIWLVENPHRQLDASPPKPQQYLADAAQLRQLRE